MKKDVSDCLHAHQRGQTVKCGNGRFVASRRGEGPHRGHATGQRGARAAGEVVDKGRLQVRVGIYTARNDQHPSRVEDAGSRAHPQRAPHLGDRRSDDAHVDVGDAIGIHHPSAAYYDLVCGLDGTWRGLGRTWRARRRGHGGGGRQPRDDHRGEAHHLATAYGVPRFVSAHVSAHVGAPISALIRTHIRTHISARFRVHAHFPSTSSIDRPSGSSIITARPSPNL